MAEQDTDRLDVMRVQEEANEIVELDRRRREAFEREFVQYETAGPDGFEETVSLLDEERERVGKLREMLREEQSHIEQLEERSAHLRTEQAVRHREQALEKLDTHNDLLVEFCDEMTGAIEALETNVERIREAGVDADLRDPQEHLERARTAIDEHNEHIEGLHTSLQILGVYLS